MTAPVIPAADRADDAARDRARRRLTWTLVVGVGLGSTGYIAAITVATLVAKELTGGTGWAGLPGAVIVIGSASGSALLSALMVRRGRRAGLAAGYGLGALGAAIALTALVLASFPLFLAGTALMGFANAANQLSRYTAADMVPLARRASAIGTVVWGATIGAVLGPNLVTFADATARDLGLPPLGGAYLLLVLFVGAAGLLTLGALRPDPVTLAADPEPRAPRGTGDPSTTRALLRRPTVALSIVALVVGQVVMTLLMTMTPLHMTEHGHGVGMVGLVLSAHTLGMFALAPVSGAITDRIGSPRTILLGMSVLAISAILAAVAPPSGEIVLLVALFLLGVGWNLGFVAGSAMLAQGVDLRERMRLEGAADALIWSSAAAASLSSGIVVAWAGYATLGLLALALVAVPTLMLLGPGRSVTGRRTG